MANSFRESMDEFLDQTVDPGSPEGLPTKIELVPEGEYKGSVVNIVPRKFQNDDGEWRAIVEMTFLIDSPEVKEETQLDEPRVRYTIFLDTPKDWDGNGNPPLEFGRNKNVQLGRLLEGFAMNDGRKFKWSSFMHEDAWLRVVKPRNPEQAMFADVAAIGVDHDSVKKQTRAKK
jgi:hypothetical protein